MLFFAFRFSPCAFFFFLFFFTLSVCYSLLSDFLTGCVSSTVLSAGLFCANGPTTRNPTVCSSPLSFLDPACAVLFFSFSFCFVVIVTRQSCSPFRFSICVCDDVSPPGCSHPFFSLFAPPAFFFILLSSLPALFFVFGFVIVHHVCPSELPHPLSLSPCLLARLPLPITAFSLLHFLWVFVMMFPRQLPSSSFLSLSLCFPIPLDSSASSSSRLSSFLLTLLFAHQSCRFDAFSLLLSFLFLLSSSFPMRCS